MSEISKAGTPSVSSPHGGTGPSQTTGLTAGEALGAHDLVYIKQADGKVYRSTGASAGVEAVQVDGMAAKAYASGQRGITILHGGFNSAYGSGLTPGTKYYLSGTNPGGLADAASTGGTRKVGVAIDDTRIRFYTVQGQ